jgi:hypothetical protein
MLHYRKSEGNLEGDDRKEKQNKTVARAGGRNDYRTGPDSSVVVIIARTLRIKTSTVLLQDWAGLPLLVFRSFRNAAASSGLYPKKTGPLKVICVGGLDDFADFCAAAD